MRLREKTPSADNKIRRGSVPPRASCSRHEVFVEQEVREGHASAESINWAAPGWLYRLSFLRELEGKHPGLGSFRKGSDHFMRIYSSDASTPQVPVFYIYEVALR